MVGGRRLVFLVGGVMGPGTISGPIREWKFCLSCSYEARPRDFLGGKCKANAIMYQGDAEDRAIPGTLIRELVARVKTLWYLVSVPQLVIVRREEARKVFPQTIVMSQSAAQYVMWGRSCPNTA
ncbi:unnamed protein product [Fusarium graminearum]|uniref:Uncharacterized protein n=1 Tax=Gibberella zeae TaxID=5518 RepID=A0A4U9EPD5_GIBZA|nr:unnamed protein product [Fusarium graminearum]